jgi:protein CpxP
MKKVFLATMMFVGLTTFAQGKMEQKQALTPEQRVELKSKQMKLDLDLNDKQTADVKKLLLEQNKKREAKKAEFDAKKADAKKPTSDELFALKNKMLDEKIAFKNEMKKILNADQFKKWDENSFKSKDRMKKHFNKDKAKCKESPRKEEK